MANLAEDALTSLVEGRMHEALAAGADVRELAALAIDAAISECFELLQVHAARQRDPAVRAVVVDCAERLLLAQFGGWATHKYQRD